ncbi:MAG: RsmB/NOP family class I SAM-dependent RNA methyltransferase [Coraliomargarita sp.]
MRSIKFDISSKAHCGWIYAVILTENYLSGSRKADELLGELPEDLNQQARARCQSLFLGALRHGHRVQGTLKPMLRKTPRPIVEAVLFVAGYEFLSEPAERQPKIVHYAVEQAKKLVKQSELGLLNAILRKLGPALLDIPATNFAANYSHPQWLVSRWVEEFGPVTTEKLLKWNQQIPQTYVKSFDHPLPDLPRSAWPEFQPIHGPIHEELRARLAGGKAYIKDPSTRLAPQLLAPNTGDSILDLCAAPGGKAFDLAKLMNGRGRIVAVDLPGARIDRLQENLSKLTSKHLSTEILEGDVLELARDQFASPFDGVMLDAPCSNTGVIQRRTDVKWRLQSRDIEACAKLQLQLLHSASRFVKPSGKLVYSTCSIESTENRAVVDAFLASKSGQAFALVDSIESYPWESGHDGAGAFLLTRTS